MPGNCKILIAVIFSGILLLICSSPLLSQECEDSQKEETPPNTLHTLLENFSNPEDVKFIRNVRQGIHLTRWILYNDWDTDIEWDLSRPGYLKIDLPYVPGVEGDIEIFAPHIVSDHSFQGRDIKAMLVPANPDDSYIKFEGPHLSVDANTKQIDCHLKRDDDFVKASIQNWLGDNLLVTGDYSLSGITGNYSASNDSWTFQSHLNFDDLGALSIDAANNGNGLSMKSDYQYQNDDCTFSLTSELTPEGVRTCHARYESLMPEHRGAFHSELLWGSQTGTRLRGTIKYPGSTFLLPFGLQGGGGVDGGGKPVGNMGGSIGPFQFNTEYSRDGTDCQFDCDLRW